MPVTATPNEEEVIYPESDGKPMADNSKQFDWIYKLAGNLNALFADRPDVYVSGNQNWYPLKGQVHVVQAPDVYVVFGRPKGPRSSYVQCQEGDVPMTAVFEILSPGNKPEEMVAKFHFYDDYGVEEYYVYDPDGNDLAVYRRGKATLAQIHPAHGFVSPRLGIRFDLSGPEMVVRYPDGRPFLMMEELDQQRRDAEQRADDAEKRADDEHKRAADEHKRAEDEKKRAEDEKKRAEDEKKRAVRLAALTQKALLGQATNEEQEELRALMAALLPS